MLVSVGALIASIKLPKDFWIKSLFLYIRVRQLEAPIGSLDEFYMADWNIAERSWIMGIGSPHEQI